MKGSKAQAVAQAYPTYQEDYEEEQPTDGVIADETPVEKKPKELTFSDPQLEEEDVPKINPVIEEEEPQNDGPHDHDEAPLVAPVKRYGPPKKVFVQLEDEDLDYSPPARVPAYAAPQARPTKSPSKKPSQQSPSGSFFPIDFGGTNGGAIAIANAFSTGEGGSASSHAVAYGSPDAARSRKAPVRRH